MSASHDGSTVYISFSTPDSGYAIPIAPANKTVVYHRQTDGSLAWVQSLDLLTTQESPLVFSPDSRFAYRFASWGGLSGSLDQYYMAPFMDVHAVNPDGSLSDPIQRFSGLPTKYTRWQDSLPFVVTNESVSAVGYGSFSIDFYVPPDYVFAAQYVEPFRRDAATGLVSGVQPGGVVVEVQDGDYHFADHLPNDLATIAGTVQYQSLTAARSPVVNNLGTFVYYIDPDQDALVTFRRNTSSGALTKDSALFYPLVPGLADAAGLALSTDGNYLFVASPSLNSISAFQLVGGVPQFRTQFSELPANFAPSSIRVIGTSIYLGGAAANSLRVLAFNSANNSFSDSAVTGTLAFGVPNSIFSVASRLYVSGSNGVQFIGGNLASIPGGGGPMGATGKSCSWVGRVHRPSTFIELVATAI